MLNNAEKLMWKYMLEHGGVTYGHSYYGTSIDFKKSQECRDLIEVNGIDWEKSKAVQHERNSGFVGTDEPPGEVTYLIGTLVTGEGKEWEWYHEYYDPINILELIKDIIPDPFTK